MRTPDRQSITPQRQPPRAPLRLFLRADDREPDELPAEPDELHLELTDALGERCAWADDDWWIQTIRRWKHRPLVIHILPTRGALAHPAVQLQLQMLPRVVPGWRLIGHIHLLEIRDEEFIQQLATSALHELRIIDAPLSGDAARIGHFTIEQVVSGIRRIQTQLGRHRPVLLQLPYPPTSWAAPDALPLAETT
ncbi:MAG TPA: hypothetical protein VGM03_15355 [Phycisphaerae bacterium]